MSSEMLYREDLEPLCPVDFRKMHPMNDEPLTFQCPETDCNMRWNPLSGYFYPETEDIMKRAFVVDFLKMSPVIEHGYFYLASVEALRKTWRCAAKNCDDVAVENDEPE